MATWWPCSAQPIDDVGANKSCSRQTCCGKALNTSISLRVRLFLFIFLLLRSLSRSCAAVFRALVILSVSPGVRPFESQLFCCSCVLCHLPRPPNARYHCSLLRKTTASATTTTTTRVGRRLLHPLVRSVVSWKVVVHFVFLLWLTLQRTATAW